MSCGPLGVAGVVVWPVGWVYFLTRWGGCKRGRLRGIKSVMSGQKVCDTEGGIRKLLVV